MILINGSWVKLHRQYSTDKPEVKLVCKGIIPVKCRNKPSDLSHALLGLKLNKCLSVLEFEILCPPSLLTCSDISCTPLEDMQFSPISSWLLVCKYTVFLLFENFWIFHVGGHYEIQTGYIHWMLFVNNFSCLLGTSNHCLRGDAERVKLHSWSISTLSDCISSIFTHKLRMEIASAITTFWQGTSMKPGKSCWWILTCIKRDSGTTEWPAVFWLKVSEINKRANSKFCDIFTLTVIIFQQSKNFWNCRKVAAANPVCCEQQALTAV